jgi:ABC-2 type transport system permease protein
LIAAIVRTSLIGLRRDRGALVLSFVLPLAFFTIFALVFGGRRDLTPKVKVLIVDEDQSRISRQFVQGLKQEGSLVVKMRPDPVNGQEQSEYTARSAERAIRDGSAPVAVVLPGAFGEKLARFDPKNDVRPDARLLEDSSDVVASLMVAGLLQKVAITSTINLMSERGSACFGRVVPDGESKQPERIEVSHMQPQDGGAEAAAGPGPTKDEIIAVAATKVVGDKKSNPMISFYAAGIGVLFLLFTASGAAGVLLDEADSGTLDRVLSSRVTMTKFMLGKLAFSSVFAFAQLVLMFLWGWAVFRLDFWTHLPGFTVMGLCTAVAVAAFGLMLASVCRTRAQLAALSTLVILVMSSVGGSMFPRFLMPESMQKLGLVTINAWAIDGFTKVFWRDEPTSHLVPQILVLVGAAIVFFAIARRMARRWEFA